MFTLNPERIDIFPLLGLVCKMENYVDREYLKNQMCTSPGTSLIAKTRKKILMPYIGIESLYSTNNILHKTRMCTK